MPFDAFMASALYEPGRGYYAKNFHQVGKDGDFFTSVSVGPLFGHLLARRFLKLWQAIGKPSAWRIIECGAHDGKLAKDVLDALHDIEPAAYQSVQYAIPEPLETLQKAQQQTLSDHRDRLQSSTDLTPLIASPLPGLAFGNELLDALPCHVVEFRQGQWFALHVKADGDEFSWISQPIDHPELKAATAALGNSFPEGYRTEVRTNYRELLEPISQSLTAGTMIWIDYGFARDDYYHPDRITGTLRTFHRHQAAEQPLQYVGDSDITAHVDFTAVKEAAESLNGTVTQFRNQGAWLTDLARDWLLSMEGNPQPSWMRQFQTLTHPAQLGSSFHVLELSWDTQKRAPEVKL